MKKSRLLSAVCASLMLFPLTVSAISVWSSEYRGDDSGSIWTFYIVTDGDNALTPLQVTGMYLDAPAPAPPIDPRDLLTMAPLDLANATDPFDAASTAIGTLDAVIFGIAPDLFILERLFALIHQQETGPNELECEPIGLCMPHMGPLVTPLSMPDSMFTPNTIENEPLYRLVATAVPVPAAAWLFGSGLLGLIGFARKKAA